MEGSVLPFAELLDMIIVNTLLGIFVSVIDGILRNDRNPGALFRFHNLKIRWDQQ